MNFFAAQDSARRNTFWLVLLFLAAVLGLVVLTNLLVLAALAYTQTGTIAADPETLAGLFSWNTFFLVALGVVVLVSGGSLYKIVALRGGGRVVAEELGGVLVPPGSKEPDRRRLLNVVEEMAIASGTPVPAVYILQDEGINAFAAGWSPHNAVIGITQGALQTLSRDELQGVIAHEFSHILHGDMRMNIQLTGILNGILLLGMIGYFVLRSVRFARSSRSEKGGGAIVAILALGLGLMVIGYVGTFFGQLIKAMVSRQREFLADASAVRYTRDRDGIAGALRKIGGASAGSLLSSPAAPEFSHAYFAQGITLRLQSVFATHPPLEQRIRRIDPQWNGRYAAPEATAPTEAEAAPAATSMVDKLVAGAAVAQALDAIDHIGEPSEAHVGYARELLALIPPALKQQTRDGQGARAVIYSLVVHPDPAARARQQAILELHADPAVASVAAEIAPLTAALDERLYLPLIDLCLPALRELSAPQYQTFRSVTEKLMAADGRLDLREWVIRRLVLKPLQAARTGSEARQARFLPIETLAGECAVLLSVVAWTEHREASGAGTAFRAGVAALGSGELALVPTTELSMSIFDAAVNRLTRMRPLAKPRLLKACVAAMTADGRVGVRGTEILRAVAATLDCPMPPVLDDTR